MKLICLAILIFQSISIKLFASPLAIQIANPENSIKTTLTNQDPETSIWWYILPTSGFALLLSLYFIKRRKK